MNSRDVYVYLVTSIGEECLEYETRVRFNSTDYDKDVEFLKTQGKEIFQTFVCNGSNWCNVFGVCNDFRDCRISKDDLERKANEIISGGQE